MKITIEPTLFAVPFESTNLHVWKGVTEDGTRICMFVAFFQGANEMENDRFQKAIDKDCKMLDLVHPSEALARSWPQ